MGKIKKLLDFEFDFEINQEDIDNELMMRNDYDYQFKQWKESEDYVEFINDEISKTKPKYSEIDITDAIQYASSHITIEPSEVGKKVYDILFSEKLEEYLSLKK